MRRTLSLLAFAVLGVSATAQAAPFQFKGSDTLFGAVTDAINTAGLQGSLQYLGGGSGLGEAGLRAGTQAIAPMSRALTDAALADLDAQGVTAVQNVIGLDGVSVYVQASSSATQIDIPTLRNIFTCSVTDWGSVPGSGKTGTINAFRRNDVSGTTDTFKTLVGVTTFGSCVTIVDTTQQIADATSNGANAVGYAGLSGERPGANKPLSIGRTTAGPFIAPNQTTIRAFSYPLARRLYLQVLSGGREPSLAEQQLVDKVLNRGFMDPILINNEFVTCPTSGCP